MPRKPELIESIMTDSDLAALAIRALKDDLPPGARFRMSRQFLRFKRSLQSGWTVADPHDDFESMENSGKKFPLRRRDKYDPVL